MEDIVVLCCPGCGEQVELALDPGEQGDLRYDCELCARTLRVVVERDEWGDPEVSVERLVRGQDTAPDPS
jgi:hypothetical protein